MSDDNVIKFDEAPEYCPKCGKFKDWRLLYFTVDKYRPGYDPLIGLPAVREKLKWTCGCGYSFFTKTKDAPAQILGILKNDR